MATANAGAGFEPVPAPRCIEPGCELARWTVKRRGERVEVSNRCYEHSNMAMFDAPRAQLDEAKRARPNRLRNDAGDLLSGFHSEVRRRRLAREVDHPAMYSAELLPVFSRLLEAWRLPVHDPFAGTGEGLGRLCDDLGLEYSGTEIEPEFIVDDRVQSGDSTRADVYPNGEYVVVTSPTYPNGMSDHFRARDASKRMTYRWALSRILGYDRELHRNNSGRYTVRNGNARKEFEYWRIVREAVAHWPARAVVNVKDCGPYRGMLYPLVAKWVDLLGEHEYEIVERIDVATPGNKFSPNRDRAETEAILIAKRP